MKIAFRDNQLCERGTTVALYDYAHQSERILGHTSVVLYRVMATFRDVFLR